jgi:GntR family transcriptional regulator
MTGEMAPRHALQPELHQPLYLQLVESLRADIAGKKPGIRVESEPQLAQRFGVSRFTVTRAIEMLVREGLITRRQGLGTFVAPPKLLRAPIYLTSFTEAMAAQGRRATHRLLSYSHVDGADAFAYPYQEAASLLRLERLRFVDGEPLAIHRSVLDAELAAKIGLTKSVASDAHFSLYRLFRQSGVEIERGVETLRARLANAREARLLQLDKSSVVMAVRRETYAADGALVDLDDAIHDASRYAYETEIRRGGEPATPFSTRRESSDASNSNNKRSFGPRIGPRSGGSKRD